MAVKTDGLPLRAFGPSILIYWAQWTRNYEVMIPKVINMSLKFNTYIYQLDNTPQ